MVAISYPPSKYDYGVQYNSALGVIHNVVLSSWNRGIRVATVPPYPTGDTGTTMAFGQAVFTQGLDDATDKQAWHHYYYTENANGASHHVGGNKGAESTAVFVAKRPSAFLGFRKYCFLDTSFVPVAVGRLLYPSLLPTC